MKYKQTISLAVLLVVLATSAITVSAAQAATEGPFYKVSGARLGSGSTKVLKASAKENYLITNAFGITITCTTTAVASGAKIVGSAGANSSTSEETMVFSGCTLSGGGTKCEIENHKITTSALKGTLGYATATRTGRLVELFKPVSGSVFAPINLVAETGGECTFLNLTLKGSVIAQLSGGGSPIEVGVNEGQGTARELVFPASHVKELWTESAGVLTKTTAGLTFEGVAASINGTFKLELESAPEWGFFT